MRRVASCLCMGLFLCALASGAAWAQATAQISGTVKDASGAVLPGVEITITQTDTRVSRNTVTNETGLYVLPELAVGPYRLEAALPGFRTYVQTGIVLQVNSSAVIDPVLQVGQVTEQVEVQANAALVETRNVGVGQVIENQRVMELPLNGRQVTDLITLSGAAVQLNFHVVNNAIMPQDVDIVVAGGLSSGVAYRLDGAVHNDPYSLNQLPLPFPDALQEFKVETSALSAQNGMSSGAAVSSVTKSGTNNFHGDLFEFVRNDLFNARNAFAETHGTLKRNQFGGTLGGPIKQNKIFFFGGYQGTTVRSDPAARKEFIPTPAMLAGDFTAFASAACNGGRAVALRAPFVNNRVDPSRLSPAALKFSSHLPTTSDPCGIITAGSPTHSNESDFIGRVDYQHSERQSVFARSLIYKYNLMVAYDLNHNLLNSDVTDIGSNDLVQSYTLGNTYLVSPRTVNAFRLGVNRSAHHRTNAHFFGPQDIGVNHYSYDPKSIVVRVTGAFSIGNGAGPQISTIYNASDDVSLIRGTHQMALGANVVYYRNNNIAVAPPAIGTFGFNGQTTGLPLADFLTGNLATLSQKGLVQTLISQWYLGAYAADAWRMTPRLTLNYGVRWEPFLPTVSRNGALVNFSEDRLKAGVKSTVFKNAPAGFYYPGDPGYPGTSCRSDGTCNATGIYSKWGEVTPRLGLGWDVQGNGRTSLRASYALAHDQLAAAFLSGIFAPPFQPQVSLRNPPGGFDNPWLGYPGGDPFPPPLLSVNVPFPALSIYDTIPYDAPPMTRHMWSLGIQRQVGADWLVSASYMGSHALHLWAQRELNPAIYIPGNCQAGQYGLTAAGPCSTTGNTDARRRLGLQYPGNDAKMISSVPQTEPGGTQSYHGLLLSVQRRAARGVTIGGNYTWSHCYGDSTSAAKSDGASYADPNNRAFDRGNCLGDHRHIFNMTAVAETPQFNNSTLRVLATGWRLSGILRMQSGGWLTITTGQDRALSGTAGQRAEQILVNPYRDRKSLIYLNPAAFALPAPGSYGNMGTGNIEGPGYWGLDMALFRTFQPFRESQKLEARFESFNVTNGVRRGDPNTGFGASGFGQILSAADPRLLQFSLKYIF